MQTSLFAAERSRQRLVSAIISYAADPGIFPEPYQRQLLDMFTRGRMTIDEVVYYLESKATSRENDRKIWRNATQVYALAWLVSIYDSTHKRKLQHLLPIWEL